MDEDDGASPRDDSDGRKKVISDAEVGGSSFDSNEPEGSHDERLQLRSRYRDLIATMQSECLAGQLLSSLKKTLCHIANAVFLS